MSTDVLAAPPMAALSPHSLAAALNGGDATAPHVPVAAMPVAPVAPVVAAPLLVPAVDDAPMPEPLGEIDFEERRRGLLVFRVGRELFAAALDDVEEAIELPVVTPLPEMTPHMLGMMRLRGALLPIYSPAATLGVVAGEPQAALVVRQGDRRLALAVDDIDDVLELRERDLRPAPNVDEDRLVRGVARRDDALVSAVDVPTLVAACVANDREAA